MRSALLQCPGDPFILSYWLRNYEHWKDEVDELRVFCNGPITRVAPELQHMVEDAGGIFLGREGRLVHGTAMQILFETLGPDTDQVMFVEDDAWVRLPDVVDAHFNRGIVGSPRGGYEPALEGITREKWGPDPECPDGWQGYGLWPCFLFGDREVLDEVKVGFPSLAFPGGTVIPGVEVTVPESEVWHTDTATLAAFMLRAKVHITPEGQWKELWLKNLQERTEHCGYEPPWFHSGGLSNQDFFAGGTIMGLTPDARDISHRMWWWLHILDAAPSSLLPDLQADYRARLNAVIEETGWYYHVREWTPLLTPWITWNDGS